MATPVLFVHGLWIHATSWDPWIALFQRHGYEASAADWPGDGPTVEATRRDPGKVAGYGVQEITDHLAARIRAFPSAPILIGHSFGGLLVQKLLGEGLGRAGIAIDPAPIRGVWELPFSVLRSGFPVLGNPFNYRRAVALTEPQFRYGFTNAVGEEEGRALWTRFAIPGPGKPIFQAAMATFNPWSPTAVKTGNAARGPLLLVAGERDHTVPPVLVRSALRCYRASTAPTEYKEFAGRGHSLTIDGGWTEIAEYSLEWLKGKGLT